MINRLLAKTIVSNRKNGFINLIYGPRRIGKTILLTQISRLLKQNNPLSINGDILEDRDLLSSPSKSQLFSNIKNHQVIFIDEAQRIPNISLSLKILIDQFPEKQFFVTGSSSLQLSKGVKEFLTGRHLTYYLFPLSLAEIAPPNPITTYHLSEALVYGGYPYLQQLTLPSDKQHYLDTIVTDYLFKEIIELTSIKQPETLIKLAKLLAFQIGSEVSLNELATKLMVDIKTVAHHLSWLEEAFIIKPLNPYSNNQRDNVVTTKNKYYFLDLGIRNSLVGQFSSINVRDDIGKLWENFLLIERLKKQHYHQELIKSYFWRNYQQAEVDLLEADNYQKLSAFEFKWQASKPKTPKQFFAAFHLNPTQINPDNFVDFIA